LNETLPQRLKSRYGWADYGTAEAVPFQSRFEMEALPESLTADAAKRINWTRSLKF
jgi:hypothetical protein